MNIFLIFSQFEIARQLWIVENYGRGMYLGWVNTNILLAAYGRRNMRRMFLVCSRFSSGDIETPTRSSFATKNSVSRIINQLHKQTHFIDAALVGRPYENV